MCDRIRGGTKCKMIYRLHNYNLLPQALPPKAINFVGINIRVDKMSNRLYTKRSVQILKESYIIKGDMDLNLAIGSNHVPPRLASVLTKFSSKYSQICRVWSVPLLTRLFLDCIATFNECYNLIQGAITLLLLGSKI